MSVSLLELSPLSSAPALTLSERGGARLDVRAGAVLDDAESTGCELAGAGREGLGFWGPAFCELGFCAHAATQPPSIATKRKERMVYFIALPGLHEMTAGICERSPTRRTGFPLVR